MCFGLQYDDHLRWKRSWNGTGHPDMTDKEKKDVDLWDIIRRYEEILKLKLKLEKLSNDTSKT